MFAVFFNLSPLLQSRSLPGQLTPITNRHQTELTLKGGKAGSASRLDPASLFEEEWEERLEKRQNKYS